MTRKEARAYITALGLHYSYDPETQEYRIAPKKFSEAQACYTNDLEDAIGTARHMAAWVKAKEARTQANAFKQVAKLAYFAQSLGC